MTLANFGRRGFAACWVSDGLEVGVQATSHGLPVFAQPSFDEERSAATSSTKTGLEPLEVVAMLLSHCWWCIACMTTSAWKLSPMHAL